MGKTEDVVFLVKGPLISDDVERKLKDARDELRRLWGEDWWESPVFLCGEYYGYTTVFDAELPVKVDPREAAAKFSEIIGYPVIQEEDVDEERLEREEMFRLSHERFEHEVAVLEARGEGLKAST